MAINPWLARKLGRVSLGPEMLPLLIEVESPEVMSEVKSRLGTISQVSVGRQTFNYIEVSAPAEAIPHIEVIPGVKMVHKSMVKRIFSSPFDILSQVPRLLSGLCFHDPIEGMVAIGNVEVPRDKISPHLILPFPLRKALGFYGPLGDVTIIPTSQSRQVLLDIPTDLTGKGITAAVLDMGWAPLISILRGKAYSTCSTDPHPIDQGGHGTWCTSCLGGSSDQSLFGECLGIAPECNLIHVKVLHGLFGFGMTADILCGIEKAIKEGAQVISLSLGGDTCEGGCSDPDGGPCPECKTITQLSKQGIIFAIAAGNSGTEPEGSWQIGCPGCAPGAITVGSVSITDYPQMAYWSSRGPSNPSNQDKSYEPKPDVAGPGGGRASSSASPDEVLISGDEGWMQPLYTGMPDPHGGMHGTSQATPAVAGLLTLLLQAGKIASADDFKAICAKMGHEKSIEDGWGVPKLSWLG